MDNLDVKIQESDTFYLCDIYFSFHKGCLDSDDPRKGRILAVLNARHVQHQCKGVYFLAATTANDIYFCYYTTHIL